MNAKIAPERLQLGQKPNQVLEATAEAIDRPSRDHVDLARRGVLQQSLETRALVATLGAADAGVFVNV